MRGGAKVTIEPHRHEGKCVILTVCTIHEQIDQTNSVNLCHMDRLIQYTIQ